MEFGPARKGDADHTHTDSAKANEMLGDEPTTDSHEDIAQCIDWYCANQDWYDPLVRQS